MKIKNERVEKTKHVFLKDINVFIKENEEWHPINFQWISVINLNNELNKKLDL